MAEVLGDAVRYVAIVLVVLTLLGHVVRLAALGSLGVRFAATGAAEDCDPHASIYYLSGVLQLHGGAMSVRL